MKLLDPLVFEGGELRVTLSPEGDAVFRVAGGESAQLVAEQAVELCRELLKTYAPELIDAIREAVYAQRVRGLRLVQGSGPEEAA